MARLHPRTRAQISAVDPAVADGYVSRTLSVQRSFDGSWAPERVPASASPGNVTAGFSTKDPSHSVDHQGVPP